MSDPGRMEELDDLHVDLDGTRLVEANAGTGKTFTITTLYLRLVMERDLDVSEIVVVTFTKAAAAELRERIRERLREATAAMAHALSGGDLTDRGRDSVLNPLLQSRIQIGEAELAHERLVRALRNFDEAAIFTIHGFCNAVLAENAFESGVAFETELVTDQLPLYDDVAQDFWTRALYDASPTFVRWLRGQQRAGQRISAKLLGKLAKRVAAKVDMPILPSRTGVAGDAGIEASWCDALDEVAALWSSNRAEVLEILAAAAEAGDLSRNLYKPDAIRRNWGAALDALLRSPTPGFATGSGKSNAWLARFTRDQIRMRTNKQGTPPSHAFFDACQALADADGVYAKSLEARRLELELELVDYSRSELERRRRLARTRSYDDLLSALERALHSEGGEALVRLIRGRFGAALIDEFQDTDPVQYSIFKRLWHGIGVPFFLIGDPKQAIYAFRGADVFAYMEAKTDAGDAAYTLSRNWRSDPSLIEAVNQLFERLPSPFVYDRIPFHPATPAPDAKDAMSAEGGAGAPLRILHLPREKPDVAINKGAAGQQVPPAVAHDIARLLSSRARIGDEPVTAGDIAVLCRTNKQAADIQSALRGRGIASVMQSVESVFDSVDAEDLERVLAAVADPNDASAVRGAAATRLLGATPGSLIALAERDDAEWEIWLHRLRVWHDCLAHEGPIQLLHRIFVELEVQQRVLSRTDGERRLTNWLHLGELLQTAAKQRGGSPRGLLGWLRRMRRDARARGDEAGEAAEIRLESDAHAVRIVTIHRSKGLQYGIVYCPYLWDGRLLGKEESDWVGFHDPEQANVAKLDLGSDQLEAHRRLASWEALAESFRLLYVALTRAEHRLVVVWGGVNEAQLSPLGQLLHSPPDAGALKPSLDVDAAEACAARLNELDEDRIRADLDALARSSDGRIQVEPARDSRGDGRVAPGATAAPLRERERRRSLEAAWRISSFSGLVSSREVGPRGDTHPAADGLDYDEREESTGPVAVELGREPGPAEQTQRVLLHDFPAGAGPGTMIHKIFEDLDFEAADAKTLRPAAARALARHGQPDRLADELTRAVADVLDTPLGENAGDFKLRDLPRQRRIDEMEFVLPVGGGGVERLTAASLADVFAEHSDSSAVRAYAARARRLGFPALEGHLRGFIDLVFEHQDRFYVVDWKSNRLGPNVADYGARSLERAMHEHDYTLQYHLYVVALHRYLSRRLPDYDYERHMGGVFYLFLRGMAPAHAPGSGIHYDRPTASLIDALSSLLSGDTDPAEYDS